MPETYPLGSDETLIYADDVRVVVGSRVWDTLTPAIRNRAPVTAAIAYIGADAYQLLTLTRDAIIIVNAGEAAVRQGSTDPRVLLRWHEDGVRIFSLSTLHAKMILVDTSTPFLVVGSANVSTNSAERLDESVIITNSLDALEDARHSLALLVAKAGPQLTADQIEKLASFYGTHRQQVPSGPPAPAVGSPWPRPTDLFLFATYVEDEANQSEDLLVRIEALSDDLGLSEAPADGVYPDGQYEVTVLSVVENAHASRPFGMNIAVGAHLIRVYAPADGPTPGEALVSPPARVIGIWTDELATPRVQHLSLLVRHYGPQRTLGDIEKALGRVGRNASYFRSYCTPETVTAILQLWPAATYDA